MKILIVSQYFWPETFRINDLAVTLKDKGNEVTILTGKPNYPKGSFYNGYGLFTHNRDVYNGIKIYRIPLIPRGNGSAFRLIFNYLSYVIFASLFLLIKRQKADITITFAISPITQVFPALLHKLLYKSKSYLWLQDLWPESVTAASKLNSKVLLKLLNSMVDFIYTHVDKILVQSEAFIPKVQERGVDISKIYYLPNWAEDLYSDKSKIDQNKYKDIIPKGFVVLFAGNIGEAQDFDSILKAAQITKEYKDIKWVLVGDGRKKMHVQEEVKRLGLEKTFVLLGAYPVEEMPSFYVHADAMLVSLKDEYIFSLTIPSKVQSYMASGKPIVSMINGIGNEIIKEANCGLTSQAVNSKALADNVIEMSALPKHVREEYGANALEYYRKNFNKDTVINKMVSYMQSDVKQGE